MEELFQKTNLSVITSAILKMGTTTVFSPIEFDVMSLKKQPIFNYISFRFFWKFPQQ